MSVDDFFELLANLGTFFFRCITILSGEIMRLLIEIVVLFE